MLYFLVSLFYPVHPLGRWFSAPGGGVSWPPGDTQQCLENFLIITASEGRFPWELVNRGRWCCLATLPHATAPNAHPSKNGPIQKVTAQAETLRSRVNRRVVSGSTVAPHGFKKSRSKLLAGEGQDRGSLTLQSVGQSPSPCITGSDS